MGGVSVAVAQAMRYAGCPNRRSLGVREVSPPTMSTAFFGFTSFFKGTVEGEYRNGDPVWSVARGE